LTLAALLNKKEVAQEKGLKIEFREKLAQDFVKALPFSLTNAQRKTAWQIYQDMAKSQPMNRLLEGDVGSGKTVVATMAAVMAMASGYQAALMVPTEILARQHFERLEPLLAELGYDCVLVLGKQAAAERKASIERLASGK